MTTMTMMIIWVPVLPIDNNNQTATTTMMVSIHNNHLTTTTTSRTWSPLHRTTLCAWIS